MSAETEYGVGNAPATDRVQLAVGDAQYQPRLGWIRVYRDLKDHPRYRDSRFVHVWLHLQLCATHKPYPALFGGKVITLQPGQLIAGRNSISDATGVEPSKVKRVLACLKSDHMIDQQGGNKSSLITVLDWAMRQKVDQQVDQQVTTNKKLRMGNINTSPTLEQVLEHGRANHFDPERSRHFFNYWQGRGWPRADWRALHRSWMDKPQSRGSRPEQRTISNTSAAMEATKHQYANVGRVVQTK